MESLAQGRSTTAFVLKAHRVKGAASSRSSTGEQDELRKKKNSRRGFCNLIRPFFR